LDFSLTEFLLPHSGPGVGSAHNRNEYQGYLLRVKGGQCLQPYHLHVPIV